MKKWKATAIHGVLDTARTLEKTVVLVVKANNMQDREAREDATECSTKKKQKKKRSTQTYRELILPPGTVVSQRKTSKFKQCQLNHLLKKKKNTEVAAKKALGELKLVQESLRKALQNKCKSLATSVLPFEVPLDLVEDCKVPTTEDIDGMLEVVLNRTIPSTDKDDEEAEDTDQDKDTD